MAEWSEGTGYRARLRTPGGEAFRLVCTKHPRGERRLAVEVTHRGEGPVPPGFRSFKATLEGGYYEKLDDVRRVLEWQGVEVGSLEWERHDDPGDPDGGEGPGR